MRRRHRFGLVPLALVVFAALVSFTALSSLGCHRAPRDKAKVIVSIFPIYDLTRRIAGEDADVVMLEPIPVSPHVYAPSPADLARGSGASLAVLIGLDLDMWVEQLVTEHGAPKARSLRLADRVPTLPRRGRLGSDPDQARRDALKAAGQPDPRGVSGVDVHVWLDPQRALLMARAITDELCRVDPAHATGYRTRAVAVGHSLEALDKELETRIVSFKGKSFATLHDAFRYYASRYHLDITAVIEENPGVKPHVRDDQMVLARMRETHTTAIFGEPQLESQPARTVAFAGHFAYDVLDPLGGSPGVDSYEALLRHDTAVLEKALAAPPPAAGDASP